MEFTSLTFLTFLCGAALIFFIIPRSCRSFWLLACSYTFYIYDSKNAGFVVLLFCATAVTYFAAHGIEKLKKALHKRLILGGGIAMCLGSLFFYKYFTFAGELLQGAAGLVGIKWQAPKLSLFVPLGISYFTFMAIAYLIDVYKEKIKAEKNFFYYALFVSFFPCVVTGPISRAQQLIPQFKKPAAFDYHRVAGGMFRILWGFFKRLVIADRLDAVVTMVYKNPAQYSGPMLVMASLLFSYELYCNFSASIDIAIGAASIFGIDVVENFNRPLSAASFSDLWRRWHISLTSWFRDYIYIPLGGNRKGKVRTYINQLVVFLVSGLWHGAAMNYIIWGLLNGVYLCVGKATLPYREKLHKYNPFYKLKFTKRIIQTITTYILFTSCIVFFCMALKGGTVADSFAFFGGMFKDWGSLSGGISAIISMLTLVGLKEKILLVLVISIALVEVMEWLLPHIQKSIRKVPFYIRWPLYYGLLLAILYFGNFAASANIYQAY